MTSSNDTAHALIDRLIADFGELCCNYGDSCCTDSGAGDAYCCAGGKRCCDRACCDPSTQKCCDDIGGDNDGYCCDSDKTCCEGDCCNPNWCQHCVDGECKSRCDSNLCEHCVDGSCQVCGGDPNQVCCDAWCCYKVWTKETITGFDQSCPACSNYYWGCVGTPKTLSSYEQCVNVGVGEGEHCECNETMQVVGYIYHCKANWDVDKIAWCLLQGAWCAAECYLFMDPAGCANCLAGIDCGGGFMEICDFVESCDPYDPSEVHDRVFTGFDC